MFWLLFLISGVECTTFPIQSVVSLIWLAANTSLSSVMERQMESITGYRPIDSMNY